MSILTLDEANRAHDEWGANCGPGALAAITGMTLDAVRPHLVGFDQKRYTNPTMMFAALKTLGISHSKVQLGPSPLGGTITFVGWPRYGLARVQWEGPWTMPGVPMRVRYRHTHWVATEIVGPEVAIFDINCLSVTTSGRPGWTTSDAWRDIIVPWLLKECVPKADGNWHITHAIEIDRAVLTRQAKLQRSAA